MVLIVLLLAAFLGPAGQSEDESMIVHRWIQAARQHRPGEVDAHLLAVADAPADEFRVVARKLRTVLLWEFRHAQERNEILRRGAVLHTDVAILLPEQAARFNRNDGAPFYFDIGGKSRPYVTRAPDPLFFATDGEYRASAYDTGHWWMARLLLRLVAPHPASDPFVRDWYRAVAAHYQASYSLGSAKYHLADALTVLPHDPMLLLYAGAMYEAYASPHVQTMLHPFLAKQLNLPRQEDEWRQAERLLREAVKQGAPSEANLRLARVLARLGRHEDAASELRRAASRLDEPRLQYLCALFLGSEEAALGRREAAEASFERAAALFPTAQSPLVALADLAWRNGNRSAALDALHRIRSLPTESGKREDPWRDYYGSVGSDASAQMSALRASVSIGQRP